LALPAAFPPELALLTLLKPFEEAAAAANSAAVVLQLKTFDDADANIAAEGDVAREDATELDADGAADGATEVAALFDDDVQADGIS
jgi:hypothetical protein